MLRHRNKAGTYCRVVEANKNVYELAELTGGVTGSICEEDYSHIMASIGDHVVKRLTFQNISLKQAHKAMIKDNSIKLMFKPAENEQKWHYNPQIHKILFDTPPIKGTQVEVSYELR